MSQERKEPDEIHLISFSEQSSTPQARERPADKGGTQQSLKKLLGLTSVGVVTPTVKSRLDRALGEVNVILSAASQAQFPEMEFESLEVGLAFTAEGDIGIVSAGVEASVCLKFKKKKKT